MSGKHINAQQRAIYMKNRQQGYSQVISAAKAGFSERSARRLDQQSVITPTPRQWRTREDVFESVWSSELVPMLGKEPTLTGLTLWEHLDDNYPGRFPYSTLRTLQRRVKHFRHTQGSDDHVIFRQEVPAGLMGLSDFTHPSHPVTIRGVAFEHIIYQFRLAASGWRDALVIQGGESFVALSEGLQRALRRLGGVPKEHRPDSLSAAFNNHHDKQTFTEQYQQLCAHYGMKPTRNNLGVAHENGAIETAHGKLKHRIAQAIKLRGSADFDSIEAYQKLIDRCIAKLNRYTKTKTASECEALQPLPTTNYLDYQRLTVKITTSATMNVKHVLYSVPAKLVGATLVVHVHHDRLIGYLGQEQVFTLQRVYPRHAKAHEKVIDWRHLIGALAKKPQAFRYSAHRDALLPDDNYKRIWQIIDTTLDQRDACKWIVSLLHIASQDQDWRQLGEKVLAEAQIRIPSLHELQSRQLPTNTQHDTKPSEQHLLADYDRFIPQSSQGVACYH